MVLFTGERVLGGYPVGMGDVVVAALPTPLPPPEGIYACSSPFPRRVILFDGYRIVRPRVVVVLSAWTLRSLDMWPSLLQW